jgi:D-glycero-alpha-D-manno-heptose-7-phosphate kinase
MIVSKTPLRISFVGGGTDLPAYYEHEHGAVVSTTIDKYVYIFVNRKFDQRYRVSYSRTENVDGVDQIQHELVRASLEVTGLTGGGIEIVSVADLPSGMGLGSSSAYTVGLLNALHAFRGQQVSPYQLAEEACQVEIDMCGKPIGKQDQYAAAFGGLNYFGFHPDRRDVTVRPLKIWHARRRELERRLLLLHTGQPRESAADILREQAASVSGRVEQLRRMSALAGTLAYDLEQGDPNNLGVWLDLNWQAKRELASGITNPQIDEWYATARRHGASGGKITGAGGGGFLLLCALPENHNHILRALSGLRVVPFNLTLQGSAIVYNDGVTR